MHQHIGRRDTRIRDPHHEDPVNYASREDWQRALSRSKIPADAKRYIKQVENTLVDGAEATFESMWEKFEKVLDRGLPVTDEEFFTYITESTRKQLRNIDREAFDSAFNGLYVEGREEAYKLTGYGDKKKGLK
jgi:hypothetical protein